MKRRNIGIIVIRFDTFTKELAYLSEECRNLLLQYGYVCRVARIAFVFFLVADDISYRSPHAPP